MLPISQNLNSFNVTMTVVPISIHVLTLPQKTLALSWNENVVKFFANGSDISHLKTYAYVKTTKPFKNVNGMCKFSSILL